MKYAIDGKPACQIAKNNGIQHQSFLNRIYRGWTVEDAATRKSIKLDYIIRKDGRYVATRHSTQQVANYLGTSKGTICGLFRHGNKINLFGYTIKRRGQRENKTGANL